MSRRKWWRWTDLFGAIGVVLLMVSIPATLAGDEATPATHEFHLPPPRAGDLLELEAVIQWKDEPARRVGPVVTVEHRVPAAHEAPVPVDFVVVATYAALNVTIGDVVVRSEPHRVETFYRDGTIAYVRSEGTSVDVWGTVAERSIGFVAAGASDLAFAAGTRVVHTADLAAVLREAAATSFRPDDSSVASGRTLEHAGLLLYAGDDGGKEVILGAMDRILAPFDGPSECALVNVMHHPRYGGTGPFLSDSIRTRGLESADCTYSSWSWYHPDHPQRVGFHVEMLDGDAQVVVVDVLPSLLIRGTGPVYTVAPNPDLPIQGTPFAPPFDPVVPLVRLGDIDEDPRPLVREITFAKLRELLMGDGAPGSVREKMADGARITDFYWREDRAWDESTEAVGIDKVWGEEPGVSTTTFETFWTLVLADAGGDARLVMMQTHDRPDGSIEAVRIWDACPREGCSRITGPDGSGLDREVADPFALIAQVRAALEEEDAPRFSPAASYPRAFAFRPHWDPASDANGRPYWVPVVETHGHTPRYTLPGSFATALFRAEGGDAFWQHHAAPYSNRGTWGADGTFALTSGRMIAHHTWDLEGTASVSSGSAEETERPLVLMASALPPAGAALGLLFVSLLVRFVSAIQTGAHLPVAVWLYAKIPKHKVLTQERRAALMDLIEAEPGITVSGIARRLGYGWGATVHHLDTLRRNGLVTKLHHGRTLHWYATATIDRHERLLFAALQHPDQAQILAAAERAPVTADELAGSVGRSRSRVSRLANRLADMGLLEKVRDGRTVRFRRAAPPAATPLEPVGTDAVAA